MLSLQSDTAASRRVPPEWLQVTAGRVRSWQQSVSALKLTDGCQTQLFSSVTASKRPPWLGWTRSPILQKGWGMVQWSGDTDEHPAHTPASPHKAGSRPSISSDSVQVHLRDWQTAGVWPRQTQYRGHFVKLNQISHESSGRERASMEHQSWAAGDPVCQLK